MRIRLFTATILFAGLTLSPVWAGPPIICHPIQIGSARSLPWQDAPGWNGAQDSYDVSHLVVDTMGLLTPQMPTPVRMETLRRAAIYSFRNADVGNRLAARLLARTLDDEAAGRPQATSWFDAGYFVEALREAAQIYPALRSAQDFNGGAWIRKAIALGGKDMQQAEAIVDAGR